MTPRLIGNLEDVLPPQILSKLSVEDTDGRPDKVKVWYPSLPGNRPPSSRTYTIGVDVAAGNGASDSVISVGDNVSMRKVFEYRSNGVTPEDLAKVTIALYRFFTTGTGKPFLAWDGGGHGIPYGTAVMRHGGIHAYYHRPKNERRAKTKTKPGVPSNRDLKKEMFSSFRGALFSGAYITPNAELYEQAEQFVLDPSGTPVHQRSQTTDNDSARGDQHGDVVTSEVILWLAMNNRPVSQTGVQRTPVGSLAWKRQQWKREEANTESMFSY